MGADPSYKRSRRRVVVSCFRLLAPLHANQAWSYDFAFDVRVNAPADQMPDAGREYTGMPGG